MYQGWPLGGGNIKVWRQSFGGRWELGVNLEDNLGIGEGVKEKRKNEWDGGFVVFLEENLLLLFFFFFFFGNEKNAKKWIYIIE